MQECICTDKYLVQHDIGADYIAGKPLKHSVACELKFKDSIQDFRDSQILQRWKWATATENCEHPYSHGPHGSCSGRSFDRT